ncbi:hypothetical protein AKO1_001867, partial [Acrasis kona]
MAANHCKRFTRSEIANMSKPIDIPFTSLSLLTPFFLSGKEDLQTIEHHQALVNVIFKNEVYNITCILTDDAKPITVDISFSKPCLLNIGVNVVMKTLLAGSGLQRAINCRKYGYRAFQTKVENFLRNITNEKSTIRTSIIATVNSLFSGGSREMSFYKQAIVTLTNKVLQCQSSLDEFFNKRDNSRRASNYEYYISNKESKLEDKINKHWFNIESSASIEVSYTKKIRPISNEVHEYLEKIYKMESPDFNTRYEALIQWEQQLIDELSSLIYKTNNKAGIDLVNSISWSSYKNLLQNEKDVFFLFSDLQQMYFDGSHEKFCQGIIVNDEINDVYSIPVRISMLSFLMSEQTHFNCKSGKDRTGELQDQCQEFAEMREQTKMYPRSKNEKEEYNDYRRHVHTMVAMNGGSLEIIKQNLGVIGSKMDTCISGRFLPGYYKKYKGLSSLDTSGISGSDWRIYENVANGA